MKRIIYWAAIMLLAVTACTQRYELDLPLALSRAEMRFKNSGDTYYVLVYSDGPWKAELGKNVDWVTLSATSGEGNAELKVTTDLNPGVSRGVTLYVSNSHGSRELYISQEKGTTDAGNYSFVKESVDVLRSAAKARIMSGTNLDEDTVSGAIDTVIYASEDEEPWIHDIEVSPKRVSFRVDENNTGAPRSAEVQISFPLARWDTPVKASFKVNQSVSDPIELEARVSPIDGTGIQFLEDDQFVLLDADGSSTISASIGEISSESATLLVNGDAVKSGILGGVYPEDYVSRWSNGKVYISLPDEQEFKTSLSKSSDLMVLVGNKEGENIQFNSACSILCVKIAGTGTLQTLSISSGIPLAGDGSIDMSAERPVYTPLSSSSLEIKVLLPEEGVSLPTELYLTIPANDIDRLTVHASSTEWSGAITAESTTVGRVHEIVPLEEVSLTLPASAEDLSAGQKWGNCYLVENLDEKMYSIDIRRPDGTVPADDIVRCGYLWQTEPNVLTYLAIDAKAGKLYFRKDAEHPGDAHIAVMNQDGVIRWSYLIWAPAQPVESRRFGAFYLMDRNLGAIEAEADDHSNASIGMHYQWGRKDPFPPTNETRSTGNANHKKVYPNSIRFVTAQNGVAPEVAHANPTTYYWGSANSGRQDWRDPQDNDLWASPTADGNPCPNGWTVAGNDVLSIVAKRLSGSTFVELVGISITDDDGKSMLFAPGGVYRRLASTASEMCNMGDGWIWSATPQENVDYQGSYRLWYRTNVNTGEININYPQRRWAGNVRCVKVQ